MSMSIAKFSMQFSITQSYNKAAEKVAYRHESLKPKERCQQIYKGLQSSSLFVFNTGCEMNL